MKKIPLLILLFLAILVGKGCRSNSPPKEAGNSGPKKKISQTSKSESRKKREEELAAARLDEKKQAFLFDAEHVTFVIEQVFGDEWKKAFRAGDSKRIAEFFFDLFAGSSLKECEFEVLRAACVTQKTRVSPSKQAEDPSEKLDAASMADYLASVQDQFLEISRLKLRVLEIEQPVADQPIWSCKILVDAVGKSRKQLPFQYQSEQRVVFEIENESELATHPVISDWNITRETFRDSDRFLTSEVTEETLINDVVLANNWELDVKHTEQYWLQYSVEDFDRDGQLDFAVACSYFYPRLFYNAKGFRFIDVASERNLVPAAGKTRIGKSFGCAWIDYDNDGYPDLIAGPRLYHNNEGKSFSDVTRNSGLKFFNECMGVLVADYDCDGRLDLYVLYQSPPQERTTNAPKQWVNETMTGAENQLWRNLGGGRFENVTRKANAGGGKRHTHAASWFFYDDDHYPDLYIANDFGKNVLLRNKGNGTFEDISTSSGTEGYSTSMGVSTGDLDNDGVSEIYVANMYSKMGRRIIGMVSESDYPEGIYEQIQGSCAGNRLYTRGSDNRFREIGEKNGVHDVGWAFGPTFFDLDGNGLLDIYATTGFMSFSREKPDG
ncbi:MAG: VCBS repeat-containing protein [Planctomycetota bacterium]|nr:VCBS repeat-containing protein [Planctomycetota bacterium]